MFAWAIIHLWIFFPVSTNIDNSGEFKECFSVQGVILPTGYYFGVSAATGALTDNHDILALRLYDLTSSEVVIAY